jgi:hypothetical protein
MNKPRIDHLVYGLWFASIALLWYLADTDVVDVNGFRYLVPVLFLGAGTVGLIASLGSNLLSRGEPTAQTVTQPVSQPDLSTSSQLDPEPTETTTTLPEDPA